MVSVIFAHQRTGVREQYTQSYNIWNMLCILLEFMCLSRNHFFVAALYFTNHAKPQSNPFLCLLLFTCLIGDNFEGKKRSLFYKNAPAKWLFISLPQCHLRTPKPQLKWVEFYQVDLNICRQIELIPNLSVSIFNQWIPFQIQPIFVRKVFVHRLIHIFNIFMINWIFDWTKKKFRANFNLLWAKTDKRSVCKALNYQNLENESSFCRCNIL